jgi:hypothetical protein
MIVEFNINAQQTCKKIKFTFLLINYAPNEG